MKTPYDTILEPIEKWCKENYFADFVVTISLDGQESTWFLEYDRNDFTFFWNEDWWEGEEDVRLLGFVPLAALRVFTFGLPGLGVWEFRGEEES